MFYYCIVVLKNTLINDAIMKPVHFDYYYYMENMRANIEVKYGSLRAYCEESGMSRPNLSNIFNRKHDMSLGTYIRIVNDLDLCSMENLFSGDPEELKVLNRISVKEYFKISQINVMSTLINFHLT